ncbi:MAG: prolyl oligopeptidase family serine peptidase [Polyangiaceae bacterium]|nr:prolyl oligopeptidase family serine peptidase [Polyangiaceae bacterium]
MDRYRHHLLAGASIGVGLLIGAPTRAASLMEVDQSDWWAGVSGLPSYVNMYLYVPESRATHPPIVVAPHHCQGTGPGTYSEMSSLVSLADQKGFIMIFPEATGQNCWDAGSERSLQHDGNGDTHAIVQMVRYALATYGGNADRVYSVGGSSGGIMTEALLGVYPDVFMAGVSLMGVPCGCWAEGYHDVVGKPADGTGQWSGPCAGGNVTKTGQEWGDLVRSYYPGYTGHRPRLQHWHGTADTTLSYDNVAEDIKEWTDVLGLSEAPTGTDTPESGTTRQFWTSSCGYTVYEAFSLSGVGHAVPFDGDAVAAYFGLDDTEGQDPETAACPGGGGTGGAGSEGGSSGTTANGGASGAGATSATGGAGGSGNAAATGGAGGSGGAAATGGADGSGGTFAAGGTGGNAIDTGGGQPGGAPGNGGTVASGGTAFVNTGGNSATGGSLATGGGPLAVGGTGATGGSSASGGTAAAGGAVSGGTPATGSAIGVGGSLTAAGSSAKEDPGSDGCNCTLVGHSGDADSEVPTLLVATLGLLFGRRRRRTR